MTTNSEMPKYQCHKQVRALKIKSIRHHENPDKSGRSAAASYGATITPVDPNYGEFDVPAEFVTKHKPVAGGYYVVYEDGYKSFSPEAAFEAGYALASNQDAVKVALALHSQLVASAYGLVNVGGKTPGEAAGR